MKIRIAYKNEQELEPVLDALRGVLPGLKVRKSNTHKPFLHAYLTTRNDVKTTK